MKASALHQPREPVAGRCSSPIPVTPVTSRVTFMCRELQLGHGNPNPMCWLSHVLPIACQLPLQWCCSCNSSTACCWRKYCGGALDHTVRYSGTSAQTEAHHASGSDCAVSRFLRSDDPSDRGTRDDHSGAALADSTVARRQLRIIGAKDEGEAGRAGGATPDAERA